MRIELILLILVVYDVATDDIPELSPNEKFLYSKINLLETEINQLKAKDNGSSCPTDWISYSDRKCFKILDTKATEAEAKTRCSALDSSLSVTLVSIDSKEEQDFLSSHLKEFRHISDYVWTGLEYVSSSFRWMDGTELNYQNWDENAIKDGSNKCVQMSLAEAELGKWTDDNCNKKYLAVCQTKQDSKRILSEEVKNITNFIEKHEAKISSLDGQIRKTLESDLPIGFIYSQLPGEKSPGDIWPHFRWQDISSSYAGVFFRVVGEGAAGFGQVQGESIPRIERIRQAEFKSINNEDSCYDCVVSAKQTQTKWIYTGANSGQNVYIRLESSDSEVRPKNMAIKIWKRIG